MRTESCNPKNPKNQVWVLSLCKPLCRSHGVDKSPQPIKRYHDVLQSRLAFDCLICRAIDGGAIDIAGYAATLGTTTSGFGKCIVFIGNSTFQNNLAMISADHGTLVASSSFSTMPGSGGSIRMIGAALWIEDTTFESNQAGSLGGAILFEQSCTPVNCFWLAVIPLHRCTSE